jgi:hypothetical protein
MDFSNQRKQVTKRMPKKVPNKVFLCFQLGNFIFPVRKFHFSRESFFCPILGVFRHLSFSHPNIVKIRSTQTANSIYLQGDKNEFWNRLERLQNHKQFGHTPQFIWNNTTVIKDSF